MERPSLARGSAESRLIEDTYPLIISVHSLRYDERTVDHMAALFERHFTRGQRYAVVNVTPRGAEQPDARQRKRIAEWAASARVREKSGQLCVGSATVVNDALARGALTAILWIWKPASPHHVTTSLDDAVDWCIAKLDAAKVPMPLGAAATRSQALSILRRET